MLRPRQFIPRVVQWEKWGDCLGGKEATDRTSKSTDNIGLIKHGFTKAVAKGSISTALVYDVRIQLGANSEKSDAVAVSLNHRDSYSIIVSSRTSSTTEVIVGTAIVHRRADIFPRHRLGAASQSRANADRSIA